MSEAQAETSPAGENSEALDVLSDSHHSRNLVTRVTLQFLFKYTRGKGRSTMPEYWLYIAVAVACIATALLADRPSHSYGTFTVVACALAIPTMAFTTRRLHDVEHKGWWMWFPTIPTYFTVKTISAAVPGYLTAYFGWSNNVAALHQHVKDKQLAWLTTSIFMAMATMIAYVIVGVMLLTPGSPEANKYGERDF